MIVSVTERQDGRGGGISAGDFKSPAVTTYTRIFYVRVNAATDGPASILAAIPGPGPALLPTVGAVYQTPGEIDFNAYCSNLRVESTGDDPYLWQVTAEYSTVATDEANLPEPETPTAQPAEVSISFVAFQRPVEKDLDGKPVVNSVNDPFDPPLEIEDSRPTITIVRNQAAFELVQAERYKDAVNSDSLLGFDPGTLRMSGISADRQFEQGTFFWKVTYELQVRRGGWQPSLLNRGFRHKEAGVIKNVTDDQGNVSNTEALLKLDGTKLNPATTEPVFLPFRVYEEQPFAALGLGV